MAPNDSPKQKGIAANANARADNPNAIAETSSCFMFSGGEIIELPKLPLNPFIKEDQSPILDSLTLFPVRADSRAASRICITITFVSSAVKSPFGSNCPRSTAAR